MKRRDIFQKGEIKEMQQGCIFSGAIAEGYGNKPVYGLIVTPRCDIAQKKVAIVHYLPIVRFEDWKKLDFVKLFQFEELKKRRPEIELFIKKKGLPEVLLESRYKMPKAELMKFLSEKDCKEQEIDSILYYWDLYDIEESGKKISSWNNLENRLSDLISGKNERFILLEDWVDNGNTYYVINLTEIRHIQLSTAIDLLKPLKAVSINTKLDEMTETDDKSVSYKICTCLTSPYIEYVCQKLSNAFFRIGIEDWENSKAIRDELKNL